MIPDEFYVSLFFVYCTDFPTAPLFVLVSSFKGHNSNASLKRIDGTESEDGEALAVIVIFLGQIAAGTSVFNLCAFLLACLVVMLVRIYGLAGKAGNMNRSNMSEVIAKTCQNHNMFFIV